MNTGEASRLARTLMNDHGLDTWVFQFDRAKRRFGRCSHDSRTISLSEPLTRLNPEEQVRDTILHEIAHALVGPGAGHGRVWKLKAREVGANPERTYSDDAVQPTGNWVGTCPTCSKRFNRVKRPKPGATYTHRGCSREPITWARGGLTAR